jgi:hypothetical protein
VEDYTAGQHPPEELYDLRLDPLEQHNLAGEPEHDEIRASLREHVLTWMEETGDPLLANHREGRRVVRPGAR